MGSSADPPDPDADDPSTAILRLPAPGPIEPLDSRLRLILDSNREFTFGFLLGYLSLALHSTLRYARFAGYFVGPWMKPDAYVEDPMVRLWGRSVTRRSSYGPESSVGEVFVVLSDGISEPRDTFRDLGVPDAETEPPRRVAVRTRTPRVDLVVRPEPGCAYELHSFAREVGERFKRNLD